MIASLRKREGDRAICGALFGAIPTQPGCCDSNFSFAVAAVIYPAWRNSGAMTDSLPARHRPTLLVRGGGGYGRCRLARRSGVGAGSFFPLNFTLTQHELGSDLPRQGTKSDPGVGLLHAQQHRREAWAKSGICSSDIGKPT